MQHINKIIIIFITLLFLGCEFNKKEGEFVFEHVYSTAAQAKDSSASYKHYIYVNNYSKYSNDFRKLVCNYIDTVSYDFPIRGITFFNSRKGIKQYEKKYNNLEDIDEFQILEDIVISVSFAQKITESTEKCPPIKSIYAKNFEGSFRMED